MGDDVETGSVDLLERLLDLADRSGVGQVWISTLRMSRDLGHTRVAITDTVVAIAYAGAQVPTELQALVDRLPRQRV